jgi:DNA-binding response OmpR family regulator
MKRRILLVDDELAILLTLRAILEMNNFDVDTAASAREAEKKLQSQTYEMVITDMRMESETAGYEVIRAARQQAYDPATAILTAYPSIDSEWQSRGAQSLLVKPVNTQELLGQIESLITSHSEHKLKQSGKATMKKVSPLPGGPDQSRIASKKAI